MISNKRQLHLFRCSLMLVLVFIFTGCGSKNNENSDDGGVDRGVLDNGNPQNSDPVPQAPVLSMKAQTKQLVFSWPSDSKVDHYQLMTSVDSGGSFVQQGATISGSDSGIQIDIAVHQIDWLHTAYRLRACNKNNQCSESNTLSVLADMQEEAIAYVKASNPDENDGFGVSVALSADGKTLAVGAYGEDSKATGINGNQADNSASRSGAVYVYVRDKNVWSQQAYIKPAITKVGQYFGRNLSLSSDGNTLLVGAPFESSDADDDDGSLVTNASKVGAVYVYKRGLQIWSEEVRLQASNKQEGDWFGSAVALSADGKTLAVGAIGEDSRARGIDGDQKDNMSTGSGAVYVFVKRESGWAQQAYVKASNNGSGDDFGSSVALSADGHVLTVGAAGEDSVSDEEDNSANDAGALYVFERLAESWQQTAYLKAANAGANDAFGSALSLSADGATLAAGASGEDSATADDPSNDGAAGAGAVYVFTKEANVWSQQAYLKASNVESGDYFSASLALSADGTRLAVGANSEDSATMGINGDQSNNGMNHSGAVYVFGREAEGWLQQTYVKAPNTGAGDGFGVSVALSNDGFTLAVGAAGEAGFDGNLGNNDAPMAGAVYVY